MKAAMRLAHKVRLLASFIFVLPAACSHYPTPQQGYNPALIGSTPHYNNTASNGTKRVVIIRYPTAVSTTGAGLVKTRYIDQNYLGYPRENGASEKGRENSLNRALAKTAFYAMELDRELEHQLPDTDVFLQPQILAGRSDGKIDAVSSFDAPPADLVVDFFVYQHPYESPNGFCCLSFGKYVAPIFSARTAPSASPATKGAIAMMEDLVSVASAGHGAVGAESGLGTTIVDFLNGPPSLGASRPAVQDNATHARPIARGQVLLLPTVALRLEEDHGDFASEKAFQPYINVVIDALNIVDHEAAVRDARLSYVSYFDPGLADRLSSGQLAETDREKLDTIAKFLEGEHTFLKRQDERLFATAYEGDMGRSVRKLRLAEAEAKDSADTAYYMQFVIAAISGAESTLPGYDAGAWARIQGMADDRQRNAETLMESDIAGGPGAMVVQSEGLFGEDMQIRAKNGRELRGKLKALYLQRFPATGS